LLALAAVALVGSLYFMHTQIATSNDFSEDEEVQ
jgi:hypothetical protein